MIRSVIRLVLRDVGIIAIVALPAFFLLLWILAFVSNAEGSRDVGYVVETGVFLYMVYVAPVVVGGIVHRIAVLLLPASWNTLRKRAAAVLFTPIIPMVVILYGERVETVASATMPIVLVLVAYGFLLPLWTPGHGADPDAP